MADVKATLETIPEGLAKSFLEYADTMMEGYLRQGLLQTRFSLRAYGTAMIMHGFNIGQSMPSESVARDIWESAEYRIQMESEEELAPDFETFYKQLIEHK